MSTDIIRAGVRMGYHTIMRERIWYNIDRYYTARILMLGMKRSEIVHCGVQPYRNQKANRLPAVETHNNFANIHKHRKMEE